ncbi:S8 family serine peptidase [Paenibacillus sp. UMB4589-SE434]|uniref:S8 family serine peptidase n=1 Tax=Paenibacillus sp. UMB4589-SE434 TaxID=3046314 RepID=UPI00254D222D|nr:S8 family serine peptidase [Paenibacillus sp. UMB4589-SE434]MDK8180791.1 S8 family serine peptidase [Paenibacillus sp. UMB4589-SE434]
MKNKRILSLVLSLAMALSLMPSAVGAYEKSEMSGPSERLLHLRTGSVNLQEGTWNDDLLEESGSTEHKLYVVQFRDVITESSKQLLLQTGAEIGDYLPDYAYLVRMNPQQAGILAANELIYNVTPFQAQWKDGTTLSSTHSQSNNYVISIFKGSESQVAGSLQQQAITITDVQQGFIEAVLRDEQIPLVLQHSDVTFVEQKPQYGISNDFITNQINASTPTGVWSKGWTGSGQVVSVADSGLDSGSLSTLHKDFEGQLHATPAPNPSTGTWSDANGHGTHVAGTVLGSGAMSNGKYKGVAYGAKLLFQAIGCGGDSICPGDVRDLFGTAKQQGAAIHTNSWGARLNYSYNANSSRVDEFTFNNKDFTVLFAAGNDGSSNNTISTPGNAKNTITVGNLQKSNPNQIASTSSRGYAIDGRIKPDLVVTGSNIISARSSASTRTPNPNNYYTSLSGTSMATPAVAGSAAIVRQFYIQNKQVTPSSALIKATLINGAEDVGYGWMSRETGWGRVNLVNSLTPTDGRQSGFIDNQAGLNTNGSISYRVKSTAGKPLKISLVWSDYQGAVQAGKQLVNDLDLEVKAPNNEILKGNCFVQNTASSTCASSDHVNNVENVYLNTPSTGDYIVTIKGYNVPQGAQPFALVVSGNNAEIVPGDTEPVVLKAPEQLTVTGVTYDTASLTWIDPNGTALGLQYEVFNQGNLIATTAVKNYTVTGLTSGQTYTFTVRAKNAEGKVSPHSSPITTKLPDKDTGTTPWRAGTAYKAGDLVSYGGFVYKCIQPHTSLTGWEPSIVPALWSRVQS